MRKTLWITLALLLTGVLGLHAQVTTEPSPLQEDSKDVVIYFHANEGNKGLINLGPTTEIYAHTGVLTSSSKDDSDWKYAPTWGQNLAKYKMEYVSENLWKLNIGDIRTYYGVTGTETVKKLAFVFRTADSKKEGKGTGNTDILVPVLESGLQFFLSSTLDSDVITPETANVTFTLTATEPADLTLKISGQTVATATSSKELVYTHFFENPGNKTIPVVATAKGADGKSKTQTMRLTYTEASPEVPYPGGAIKMGPVRNDDGTVTFCIGAPQKAGAYLLGSWNNFEAGPASLMNSCVDENGFRYFWQTVSGLENDKQYPYYFLIDGKHKVGDPYARLVLDPDNDKYISPEVYPDLPAYPSGVSGVCLAIYQGNINDYDWQVRDFKAPAKDNLVIYELLFRDFTGTEGAKKGDGTVRQAIEKLPYLKSLGINAIELLPINEFNGNISWGYNPNFYFAPDKAYGTPDDYKEFIDLCHANGIAVILDVVFNQTDWQHPWYKMYDVDSNPFYNPVAPHAYSVLNDINQGNPLIRQQWVDMLRYWIEEYNVDGYRFDLVKGLGDNDSYANNGDAATNAYNASRVANMKYLKESIDQYKPEAYFINENLAGTKEENEMAALGMLNWANVNYSGCQYAKGNSSSAGLSRFYAPLDGPRTWGSTVSYLESHDEQRLAYEQDQYGLNGVKGNLANSMHRLGSAAAQMIMVPGSHMIWQFSEMGNYDSTKSADGGNNTDPKPVRWNLLDDPDRAGLVENYSELIRFRLANQEHFSQDATVTDRCGDSYWKNGRFITVDRDGKQVITVTNPLITEELTVAVPFSSDNQDDYEIICQSYDTQASFSAKDNTVTLPANCFVVIASKGMNSAVGEISEGGNSLMVYGTRGSLVVDNASAPVNVYTLDGRRAATLEKGNGSVELPAGVYVVRSGSDVRKIVVR